MRTRAPEYIRNRRESDPRWVSRNKRSRGRNKQLRACIRLKHDAEKALAKLREAAAENNLAKRIEQRLGDFFGRFIPHRAQARG